MKIFSYILALILTASALSFSFLKEEPKYNPSEIDAIYPSSLSELTKEEKLEAFTYMLNTGDCTFNGISLKGKVEFVTSFPDFKIEYVTSFPDIKVKFVTSFPDDCGEWQEVTSFPDFKVQVVTSFPDLKVQKVTSFPGMN